MPKDVRINRRLSLVGADFAHKKLFAEISKRSLLKIEGINPLQQNVMWKRFFLP